MPHHLILLHPNTLWMLQTDSIVCVCVCVVNEAASAAFRNSIVQDRLQTGAILKHFPLQILYEKARLQTGAGLKHFPLRILYEKL